MRSVKLALLINGLLILGVTFNCLGQPPLELVKAQWGRHGTWKDVTGELRTAINNYCGPNATKWSLSNENVGKDKEEFPSATPASWQTKLFGKRFLWGIHDKILKVDYKDYGIQKYVEMRVGKPLNITATPPPAPTPETQPQIEKVAEAIKDVTILQVIKPRRAVEPEDVPTIRYGDIIRLSDASDLNNRLHSHNIKYYHAKTSGQQQVTGGFTRKDGNDWWVVESAEGKGFINKVESGDRIMLKHVQTGLYLHSHTSNDVNATKGWDAKLRAPDGTHREITCFKGGAGNIGNHWRVVVYDDGYPAKGGSDWVANKRVVLERYNPNIGKPGYTVGEEYVWVSDKNFDAAIKKLGYHDYQKIVALNATPTYWVVEDIKNEPSYKYTPPPKVEVEEVEVEEVEVAVNLAKGWEAEEGKLKAVAVGSRDEELEVWGIGMDKQPWKYNPYTMVSNPWVKQPLKDEKGGRITRLEDLSISSDGRMVAVRGNWKAVEYDWKKEHWKPIPTTSETVGINFEQISVGNDKTLVAIPRNGRVLKHDGKDWEEISPAGTAKMAVASLEGKIFGLNPKGEIFKYKSKKDVDKWKELPSIGVEVIWIAVGNMDNLLAIDKELSLWKYDQKGKKWEQVLGEDGKPFSGLTEIAINAAGTMFGIDGDGDVYHKGESGVKVTPDKKAKKVKPKKETRRKARKAGKLKRKKIKRKTKIRKKRVPKKKIRKEKKAPKKRKLKKREKKRREKVQKARKRKAKKD